MKRQRSRDPATFFRFLFHCVKKDSCQLLAKVDVLSTGQTFRLTIVWLGDISIADYRGRKATKQQKHSGRSGGTMVLGKLKVPGRPTNLENSRIRAYYACSRYGWVLFGKFFLSFIFSVFFLFLSG